MPKELRTFLADFQRPCPNETVRVDNVVNPSNCDGVPVIKHAGACEQFPALIFERPRTGFGVRCCSAFPSRSDDVGVRRGMAGA